MNDICYTVSKTTMIYYLFNMYIDKIIYQLFHVPGVLTEEYFDKLAYEIGDGWTRVVLKLGHDNASIQRIQQNCGVGKDKENKDDLTSFFVKEMLVEWYKTQEKNKSKVKNDYCKY